MIALALAAGCGKPTTQGPPPAPPPSTTQKITFNFPIPKDCPVGTTPDASENYTITLGPNFKLTDPDVSKGGHKEGKPKNPRAHPTKLDITTDILAVGKAGTVTIVLSKKLHFATPDLAFNGADADAQKIFCNPTYTTNPDTLTFTVLPNTGVPYGSYILGLVADDANGGSDTLPVFIDPGVENDG